jgi:hypothetical protein
MTTRPTRTFFRTLAACAVGTAIVLGVSMARLSSAKAAPAFDGNWSVLIITTKGDCDRGYRYPVRIVNGKVGYAGEASFTVKGDVDDRGAITVTVARGDKYARGSGTLSGTDGTGTWKTGGGECSGEWTAERRS